MGTEEIKKPITWKTILHAIIGTIIFYSVYIFSGLILGVIFLILLYIPILNNLLSAFFHFRGDAPSIVIVMVGAFAGYSLSKSAIAKLSQNIRSNGVSHIITGAIITLIQLCSLVTNLLQSEYGSILQCIILVIVGIVFISSGTGVVSQKE